VADTSSSPGDDACNVWHLYDLIPEGASGWQPKSATPIDRFAAFSRAISHDNEEGPDSRPGLRCLVARGWI
jgi:hypothetical protein